MKSFQDFINEDSTENLFIVLQIHGGKKFFNICNEQQAKNYLEMYGDDNILICKMGEIIHKSPNFPI